MLDKRDLENTGVLMNGVAAAYCYCYVKSPPLTGHELDPINLAFDGAVRLGRVTDVKTATLAALVNEEWLNAMLGS